MLRIPSSIIKTKKCSKFNLKKILNYRICTKTYKNNYRKKIVLLRSDAEYELSSSTCTELF